MYKTGHVFRKVDNKISEELFKFEHTRANVKFVKEKPCGGRFLWTKLFQNN